MLKASKAFGFSVIKKIYAYVEKSSMKERKYMLPFYMAVGNDPQISV